MKYEDAIECAAACIWGEITDDFWSNATPEQQHRYRGIASAVLAVVGLRNDPSPPERKPCKGFQWVGQSFEHCDGCGEPYWEHTHDQQINRDKGPFDEDPWLYVPISNESKAKVKARYRRHDP